MKIYKDEFLPKDTNYFLNEDYMYYADKSFHPTLIQKILHFFGKHIYVWYESQCQFPDCKDSNSPYNL